MKIYVANLAAYNNGELRGEWFDLPVDIEEVFQTIFTKEELDENGQPYGDYAIHDYELPFQISEYASINVLNDMAELIYNTSTGESILSGDYNANDLISFAQDLGFESCVDDIVPLEVLVETIKSDAEKGDIHSIKNKLEDVRTYVVSDDDYFIVEGDGNFKSIERADLDSCLYDIFTELKSNCQ